MRDRAGSLGIRAATRGSTPTPGIDSRPGQTGSDGPSGEGRPEGQRVSDHGPRAVKVSAIRTPTRYLAGTVGKNAVVGYRPCLILAGSAVLPHPPARKRSAGECYPRTDGRENGRNESSRFVPAMPSDFDRIFI